MNTKIDSIGFWNKESAYPTGKSGFPAFMAAFALAIFTFAAAPARADPLTDTNWLTTGSAKYYSGISVMEFTLGGNGVGNFGTDKDRALTYTMNPDNISGTVEESKTKYTWDFTLDGNVLTFPNGMHPHYPYGTSVSFAQIEFPPWYTLNDLSDTDWLGWTNRGETLLNNIMYDPGTEAGTLDCTTGPAAPMEDLAFSYTYDGPEGTGKVPALGTFTTDDDTATMTFSNFMALGSPATFRLFNYVQ
jgi:hypothetical protein